jgi:hypothetical protein
MTQTQYLWRLALLTAGLVALLLWTAPELFAAERGWRHHHTQERAYRQPRKQSYKRNRDREEYNYYRREEDRGDEEFAWCGDKVRGLGTQWIGTKGAMDAAWKDWMERVRYDMGESFLDRTHALGMKARCGRVSIGETLGQVMYRCEIVARPCRGDFAETRVEAEGAAEK